MNEMLALRLFCRVVERASFSAVARELQTSQPNVSRQVSELETRLGVQLLSRSTRRVSPTEAGRAFYEQVRPALQRIEEAQTELRSDATVLAGAVRVAAPAAFGQHFVVPALAQLMAEHPQLDVQLLLSDSSVDLVGEAVDVALRIATGAPAHFKQRTIGNARQVAVAARGYLERRGRPQALAELSLHDLLLPTTTRAAIEQLRSRPEFAGLPEVSPRFVSDDILAVAAMTRAGLGVTVLPEWLVAGDLEVGDLERLWPELELPGAPILALHAPAPVTPRRIQAVLDAVATRVGAHPATR